MARAADSMVGMTQPPGPIEGPTPNDATPGTGLDRFFDWVRSLDIRRSPEEKWLTGASAGLARRLGVDPLVVRAGFILLALLGGVGVTLYLIAWAFLPNDRSEIIAERAVRHGELWPIVLLAAIVLSLVGGTGFAHDGAGPAWFWWVAVPVAVVFWAMRRNRRGEQFAAPLAYAAPAATSPANQPLAYAAPTGTGAAAAGAASVPPPPAAPVAPRPARAPRPPRPPRAPRRHGPGFGGVVLVAGLALAAYGLGLWSHDTFGWRGSGGVVALAAALGVTGVAVIVLGATGRRAGFVGFIAVVLAIATWTATVVPTLNVGGGVGDRIWRPSPTDTTDRYRLGIGSAELDLTQLGHGTGSARALDAGIGVGELRIRVPANLTVEVRSSVGAGDVGRWFPSSASGSSSSDNPSSSSGPGGRNISTVETLGSGSPDVVVTAHVGLGQILVGKE